MTTTIDRSRDALVRFSEVQRRTGLSRTTIYRKIEEGEFPTQVPLGPRSVGWYESDINRWVSNPTGWKQAA